MFRFFCNAQGAQVTLINTQLDIAFKGTVVNQTLPSLHGGSLEIILSPFNGVAHQYLT